MTEPEIFSAKLHGQTIEIQLAASIEEDPIAPFDLRAAVEALVEQHQLSCVIVSLSQLTRCTTPLINGLINLHKSLSQSGQSMKLCHVPIVIRQILNELKLENVFLIFPSVSDALRDEGA